MDKTKIEKIINIFCDSLNITDYEYRNIINELMLKIIKKYEPCSLNIKDEQQYLINSDNTIETFFLNRLLFNVTSFEGNNSRSSYNFFRGVEINKQKLATSLDNFKNFTEEQKKLAAKKVIMHEFEHAIQTKYEFGPYINDFEHYKNLYKELKKENLNVELNDIYDGRKLMPYMGNGQRIQSGLAGHAGDDKYKPYAGTFYLEPSNPKYMSENNINEIFNESEALLMSNSDGKKQVVFSSGNKINIRNRESSNYLITNYGFMLKELLGEQRTFEGMYLDRDVIIDYFNDNFSKIFEQVFGEHLRKKYPNINFFDGWSMLHATINETKYSYDVGAKKYSEICHLKMNLALSLCLEKVIKEKIDFGEPIDEINELYNNFVSFSLYNDDVEKNNNLPHMKILNNLKKYINNNTKLMSNHNALEEKEGSKII